MIITTEAVNMFSNNRRKNCNNSPILLVKQKYTTINPLGIIMKNELQRQMQWKRNSPNHAVATEAIEVPTVNTTL